MSQQDSIRTPTNQADEIRAAINDDRLESVDDAPENVFTGPTEALQEYHDNTDTRTSLHNGFLIIKEQERPAKYDKI